MLVSAKTFSDNFPIVPLGKAVEFLDNLRKPVTASDRTAGEYPYYGANGLQGTINDYIFDEPLVLLAEDGGFFGMPDKTIAYQVSGKCWVNNHAHVLRPKQGVDIRYLLNVLQKYDVTPYTNGTTRAKLTKGSAERIPIPLPPLEEQMRIAAILDKTDAIRRKRAESLKLLDELLRATFLDMFGDPITNPKGWRTQKFEEFGKIDRGKSKHRPRDAKGLYGGKYPFIQTGDVANCGGYIRSHKQTYSELGLKQSRLWPANTLCITIAANIAKTGILTFDACFPDSVVGFTPSQPYYLQYIRFVLNFLQPLLEKQAPQSAQKNINLEILSRLEFPIPTKGLLEKFAVIEKKIMDSEQLNQLILAESDTLFHSLVARAFKGEL